MLPVKRNNHYDSESAAALDPVTRLIKLSMQVKNAAKRYVFLWGIQ
jgi:hypothetical protein